MSASEKIYQIAKAIEAKSNYVISKHHAKALARVAVEALREPTEDMTRNLPNIDVWGQSYLVEGQAEEAWRAMIDAILK